MHQNVIVIDDFYSNPDEVRKFALSVPYPEPEGEYTYPGKNSDGSWYPDEVHKKFEDVAKEKLIPADKNGYFRISLEGVTHKQDIHVDPAWEWGAVLYLSDPKDCVDEGWNILLETQDTKVREPFPRQMRKHSFMVIQLIKSVGGPWSMAMGSIEISGIDTISAL